MGGPRRRNFSWNRSDALALFTHRLARKPRDGRLNPATGFSGRRFNLTGSMPSGFEEKPSAPLGLVDPDFEQARGCDIAMLIANIVRFAHPLGKLEVVLAKLRQHVVGRDEIRVIVGYSLQLGYMTDRTDGGPADLARPLGDLVGRGEDLGGLLVEEQVVVAEMRTGHMPVEVLGLEI